METLIFWKKRGFVSRCPVASMTCPPRGWRCRCAGVNRARARPAERLATACCCLTLVLTHLNITACFLRGKAPMGDSCLPFGAPPPPPARLDFFMLWSKPLGKDAVGRQLLSASRAAGRPASAGQSPRRLCLRRPRVCFNLQPRNTAMCLLGVGEKVYGKGALNGDTSLRKTPTR